MTEGVFATANEILKSFPGQSEAEGQNKIKAVKVCLEAADCVLRIGDTGLADKLLFSVQTRKISHHRLNFFVFRVYSKYTALARSLMCVSVAGRQTQPPLFLVPRLFCPPSPEVRRRRFRRHLPLLHSQSSSKQSLQNDPEAGRSRDVSSQLVHESLALGELLSLPDPGGQPPSATPSDGRDLPDSEPPPPPPPVTASLRPPLPFCRSSCRLQCRHGDTSLSSCSLVRSRDSLYSLRRASSVDDIESMRADWDRKLRSRAGSTGAGGTWLGPERLLQIGQPPNQSYTFLPILVQC